MLNKKILTSIIIISAILLGMTIVKAGKGEIRLTENQKMKLELNELRIRNMQLEGEAILLKINDRINGVKRAKMDYLKELEKELSIEFKDYILKDDILTPRKIETETIMEEEVGMGARVGEAVVGNTTVSKEVE